MTTEIKAILIIVLITAVVIVGGLSLTKNGPQSPTITINEDSLITADNPRQTGSEAKIKVVEFADFACPACAMLAPNLEAALATNANSIDFAVRLLPIHGEESYTSATAAFAAGEQGKFFEYGKILFDKQTEWANKNNKRELFLTYATTLGLDIAKFTASIDSKDFQSKVKGILDKDNADASAMKIASTPTLVIGGTPVVGVQTTATLDAMLKAEIEKATGTGVDTDGAGAANSSTTPTLNINQ